MQQLPELDKNAPHQQAVGRSCGCECIDLLAESEIVRSFIFNNNFNSEEE